MIVDNLDDINKKRKKKFGVPDKWDYVLARNLFQNPEVADVNTFDYSLTSPKRSELIEFLVSEKQFKEKNVKAAIKRLEKNLKALKI